MSEDPNSTRETRKSARSRIKESVKEYRSCKNIRSILDPIASLSINDPGPEPLGWTLLHTHNTNAKDGSQGTEFVVDEIKRPPMPKIPKKKNINRYHPDHTAAENLEWAKKMLNIRRFAGHFLHFPMNAKSHELVTGYLKFMVGWTRGTAENVLHRHYQLMSCSADLRYARMCTIDIPLELLPNRLELSPFTVDVALGFALNGQFICCKKISPDVTETAQGMFEKEIKQPCECGDGVVPDIHFTMVFAGKVKTGTQCAVNMLLLLRQFRAIYEISHPDAMLESRFAGLKGAGRRLGRMPKDGNARAAKALKDLEDAYLEIDEKKACEAARKVSEVFD